MSARDELAEIIQDCGEYIPGSHADDYVSPNKAAEAILAAGYSKPRTITTAEELDGLPVGAVVLAREYLHHSNGARISFQRWGDGAWHRGARSASTHPDNIVPASVIHDPSAA